MASKSVFIFRRDLRLIDNTGLIKALEKSSKVLCCFIFNPSQLDSEKNTYRSENAVQFMIGSLNDLNDDLVERGSKLYTFKGKINDILTNLKNFYDYKNVYMNKDYTPFSKSRDCEIQEFCNKNQVDLNLFDDLLLHNPEVVKNVKPFTVFTPFYKHVSQYQVEKPKPNNFENYFSESIDELECNICDIEFQRNENIALNGGRKEALALLRSFSEKVGQYTEDRDFPYRNGTSMLSAHNKFGTLSIREIYNFIQPFQNSDHFLKELYWRDFMIYITDQFPKVLQGFPLQKRFENLQWVEDDEKFQLWCQGKTGFPFVDAGMRELNKTGFMHNRTRMICASFLTKDLHINWTLGEKYFSQKLIDYDPSVNNASWQAASAVGSDPKNRIFNPWLQQQKFDEDCIYIKKYIEELSDVPAKAIHGIERKPLNHPEYPNPILNHSKEKFIAEKMFSKNKR